MDKICPCGDKLYKDCCEPFHQDKKTPTTPEELMRSRYSAFALKNIEYIDRTMKGPAREGFNAEGLKANLDMVTYEKLEVLDSELKEDTGTVEFKVFYSVNGENHYFQELSTFIREDGRWYYYDGKVKD